MPTLVNMARVQATYQTALTTYRRWAQIPTTAIVGSSTAVHVQSDRTGPSNTCSKGKTKMTMPREKDGGSFARDSRRGFDGSSMKKKRKIGTDRFIFHVSFFNPNTSKKRHNAQRVCSWNLCDGHACGVWGCPPGGRHDLVDHGSGWCASFFFFFFFFFFFLNFFLNFYPLIVGMHGCARVSWLV